MSTADAPGHWRGEFRASGLMSGGSICACAHPSSQRDVESKEKS